MSCEFKSCTCHNKNTVGEKGNGKPPHIIIEIIVMIIIMNDKYFPIFFIVGCVV